MIIRDLIYKLALLVTFSVISGFISTKFSKAAKINTILQGLLFGIASCIGMYDPFLLEEGIIFDGRSIVISLCTLFFGPVAGAITSLMAIIYRNILGGPGTLMGSMVIISSFLIGYYFYYRRSGSVNKTITWLNLYLFGIVVHLVMLILIITLPGIYVLETYRTVALTVIGFYPVITLLIGKILIADEDNRNHLDEIRKREVALIESEERYRKLLESAPVGIAVHSKDAITYINTTGAKLLGAETPGKIVGQHIRTFIHPIYLEKMLTKFEKLLRNEKVDFPADIQYTRLDGSIIDIEIMATYLNHKDTPAFQFIYNDTTLRKKAESEIKRLNYELEQIVEKRTAQLIEANKELEAYTYTISHDLRAPLRAIDGFTRYLGEEYGQQLDPEGNQFIQIIRQNSKRMGQMIDDLLDFSKFGNATINAVQVNMTSMVHDVFRELNVLSGRNIEFKCPVLEDAVCDQSLIRQVWTNLIANAIKYSSGNKSSAITIGCIKDNDWLTYHIRDNGVGFDNKYAGKLFGVFQRLHSNAEFDGTGVGLAIVKRIVERMGGKVWAEGTVNLGATFYFSLPYKSC